MTELRIPEAQKGPFALCYPAPSSHQYFVLPLYPPPAPPAPARPYHVPVASSPSPDLALLRPHWSTLGLSMPWYAGMKSVITAGMVMSCKDDEMF